MSEKESAMAQEQSVRHHYGATDSHQEPDTHAQATSTSPSKAALAALETLLKTTNQAIKDLDKGEIELHAKRVAAETYDVLLSIPETVFGCPRI